ncbi:MAG: hypothetical protein F6K40_26345 [Okeania sp. SIO3I5]|uniref:hypothetical protein n=1 Tax=Okeania sp. SIO3I5 TaxID=2607805 RepID=UPI0013B62B81|nr:hypothetical protein [Okeania sp. SIO3I5]NEQ39585.1 hypothetical protein [Okeania sp. SIO3I5]
MEQGTGRREERGGRREEGTLNWQEYLRVRKKLKFPVKFTLEFTPTIPADMI